MTIYTITPDGKMDHSFCPFIDGTMKGPDAVLGLIKYYLSHLDISNDTEMKQFNQYAVGDVVNRSGTITRIRSKPILEIAFELCACGLQAPIEAVYSLLQKNLLT